MRLIKVDGSDGPDWINLDRVLFVRESESGTGSLIVHFSSLEFPGSPGRPGQRIYYDEYADQLRLALDSLSERFVPDPMPAKEDLP